MTSFQLFALNLRVQAQYYGFRQSTRKNHICSTYIVVPNAPKTTTTDISLSNPAAKPHQTAAPQSPKAKQSPNHANPSANSTLR